MEDSSLFELIELSNGDIALQRVDKEDKDQQPLVRIQFSDESEVALNTLKMAVARAMVEAGIEAYSEIQAANIQEADAVDTTPVIH